MRTFAILRRSAASLWRFPLRSGLTLASAALGVAGALTSVNFALGGRQKVAMQLAGMGTNVLTITPEGSRSIGGRARTAGLVTTLTPADLAAIRRDVAHLSRASAVSSGTFLLKAGDLAKNNCVVVGIEPAYLAIRNWPVREGREFGTAEMRRMARVALLGASVAREIFGSASPIGRRIFINRVPFQVTGVLQERGQSLDAANEDEQVYVPLTTAMHRLANVDYYSAILLAVEGADDVDRAGASASLALRRRHKAVGKLPDDFQVRSRKSLLDAQVAASNRLLFFVRWIGAAALGVSGLGVLAIAWIGTRERTREFGIRRALGGTRTDIFIQVAGESVALSAAGCVLGLGVAAWASGWLAQWTAQPRVFDPETAWTAVGLAGVLNLGFAALPARGAARVDPILALRYE